MARKRRYYRIDGGDKHREGVVVECDLVGGIISVSGHYDSFVGIEGFNMPIGEFLRKLGLDDLNDVARFLQGVRNDA